tara:strand:+ start:6881 stop:7957 length:1077 start_codon:yes stop_codon:yes gene_type:complete
MSIATLGDIITKVRKLTGTGNSLQLTDSDIIDYINSFYLYDFPAEFRSLQLKDVFTINTIENIDVYPFDYVHYSTLSGPAFVDRKLVSLYSNPNSFFDLYFNVQETQDLDTGDGTTGAYSGTLTSVPIRRSFNNNPMTDTQVNPTVTFATGSYPASFAEPNPSRVQNILITANTAITTLNVTDDGNGNLIGDCSAGAINYTTGAVTGLVFNSAIPSGNIIKISYYPSNMNVPQAVLFNQNQITLRPVPDRGYTIQIEAWRRPSQVLLGTEPLGDGDVQVTTGIPELLEWWETLAAGSSKKIFEDRQDLDGIIMMDKMLQERYALNETRTYAQLGTNQVETIFNSPMGGCYNFRGSNGI